MPLYEYYCSDCNGVFELLRSTREASEAQPCPECDEDAERIMSKQWAAFIFREGMPRRLPDDGKYWYGKHKVSTRQTRSGSHPEVPKAPEKAPTTDELESWEYRQQLRRQALREGAAVPPESAQERAFKRRMSSTRGSRQEQEIKRRIIRSEREDKK